jgi:hypothetical protein
LEASFGNRIADAQACSQEYKLSSFRLHVEGPFLLAFFARDGVDLQMDALLCAKLHRAINEAQLRARKREQKTATKSGDGPLVKLTVG